ncbi:arginine repressor [Clostridia bacterium]|nr:arginine repressor [Clostridia bacterium]
MGKKDTRQDVILQIIAQEVIDTQEALTSRLNERGYHATQATVSRDIKDLMLTKMPVESGGSRYVMPASPLSGLTPLGISERMRRIFSSSVMSFTQAQNLVVVKTMPGAAQTACEAVDTSSMPEVVGTLAGDNTFIIIARNNDDVPPIIERLIRMRDGITQDE